MGNGPWNDGVWDQKKLANAIQRWSAFHDTLPNSIENKILKAFCGMLLHSQLYSRADIRGDALNDVVLCFEYSEDEIVDAVTTCTFS